MGYKVELIKENNRDILRFHLKNDYDIDLNSEEQKQIKELFYELISLSFEKEIIFELNSEGHGQDLFYDISKDYIGKLEEELKIIRSQIPDELVENPDEEFH